MPYMPPVWKQRSKAKKKPRPSRVVRGYGYQWQKKRAIHLEMFPYCRVCGDIATVVDHYTPLSEGGVDEPYNYQSMCVRCHNRKTGLAGGNKRKQ